MDFLDFALPAEPIESDVRRPVVDPDAWPPMFRKETTVALILKFRWLSPEQLAIAHGCSVRTIFYWASDVEGDQAEQAKVRRLLHLDHA